ncbi:site-specific recombinase [Mycobacterium pseudoshottsii JCM 15466]|nr:site-specific recombinase [Mycobacterium pseudoshottsii JCM 15466]
MPKALPKSYTADAVNNLIAAIDTDDGSARRSNWPERDRAIIFTALLTGLRADELIRANIGDIRCNADGGVLHVSGKGNKDRRIPCDTKLIEMLQRYLQTREDRIPHLRKRSASPDAMGRFSPTAPLFVGSDGERITRGTLQYRILRGFKKAGINNDRAAGALVHGLRHTFATELANANVSVYALMKLLGHESMVTSQRYVDGAAADTRRAAERNPLYSLLNIETESQ